MKNCEHFESQSSAWLDAQLDRPDQVECLDHLVRCASCREFYVDARALDGLLSAIRTPADATKPSPEVWKRIEWTTRSDRARSSRRRIPAWAMQAAAVLVLAIGLAFTVWNGGVLDAPMPDQAEITLGESSDMTDSRFVELTREVLRADRQYHSEMYRIMEQVVADTETTREASAEERIETPEVQSPVEGTAENRLPA